MKLIILDRDGVINQDSDAYVKSVDEWIPIAGSIDAIARLSRAGFTLVVATNQSGLARGLFDLDDLEAMHTKLNDLVIGAGGELSGIFYCPHGPDDGCHCRKPAAGLLDCHCRRIGYRPGLCYGSWRQFARFAGRCRSGLSRFSGPNR